jgi:DNA-binding transcriptional regulator GbsR (MarR family)
MSTTAHVKSIEALQEWKTSIKRFVDETQQLLQSAEQKIQRTEEWLQGRSNHWHHEVEQCREGVRQAKRDLQECRDDENNDCSTEEEALIEAGHKLSQSETELENIRRWKAQVTEMAAAYRVQAKRLRRLLDIEMPRADAFLGKAINDLHMYITGVSLPQQATLGEVSLPVSNKESAKKLEAALVRLSLTKRGRAYTAAIEKHGTKIKFGYLPSDRVGQYYEVENEIVISWDQRHKSKSVLSSYIAHEGKHVELWFRTGQPNSVDEEYQAYKAQAEVWEEVKGDESDENCDEISALISLGEDRAKDVIHFLRPDLPDTS